MFYICILQEQSLLFRHKMYNANILSCLLLSGSSVIVNGDEFENIELARQSSQDQTRSSLGPPAEVSPHHVHHNPSHHPPPTEYQFQGDPLGVMTDLNRNIGKSTQASACDIVITDADVNNTSGDMLREMVKNKVSCLLFSQTIVSYVMHIISEKR